MERMMGFDREGGASDNTSRDGEFEGLDGGAGDARFDAAQYEFFGKSAMEEIELGGLEDDGDGSGFVGLHDGDYSFSTYKNRQESDGLGHSSEIDDLASNFLKSLYSFGYLTEGCVPSIKPTRVLCSV